MTCVKIASAIGAGILGATALMSILLAAGLPLGEFLLGGAYDALSVGMRVELYVTIAVQLAALIIILQTGGLIALPFPRKKAARIICFVFAAYLSLNCVMNLLSHSVKEKLLMTPLAAAAAVCFWITAVNSGKHPQK